MATITLAYADAAAMLAAFKEAQAAATADSPLLPTPWLVQCHDLVDVITLADSPDLVAMIRWLVSYEVSHDLADADVPSYLDAVSRWFAKVLRVIGELESALLCSAIKADGRPCSHRAAEGYLTCNMPAHRHGKQQIAFFTDADGVSKTALPTNALCYVCNRYADDHDSVDCFQCYLCPRSFYKSCVPEASGDDKEHICSVCYDGSRSVLALMISKAQDENGNPIKGIPRHPIVEDDVIVYSGATILGRVTIGAVD